MITGHIDSVKKYWKMWKSVDNVKMINNNMLNSYMNHFHYFKALYNFIFLFPTRKQL